MEEWNDYVSMEDLNYNLEPTTYRYEFYQCEHNWVCSRWNHGPNYETTEERCLRCREVRPVESI